MTTYLSCVYCGHPVPPHGVSLVPGQDTDDDITGEGRPSWAVVGPVEEVQS